MSALRFFTDEDVYGAIAPALRRARSRCRFDAGDRPPGESDESQFEWASAEGRMLVTFNAAHFAELHAKWLRRGQRHAGIVVSTSGRSETWSDVSFTGRHIGCRIDAATAWSSLATGRSPCNGHRGWQVAPIASPSWPSTDY